MKFEINDKTGMIEADNQGFDEYWPADAKDLEAILQAVKKTQEKLVNKQIQEIQNSKNIKTVKILKRKYIEDKPNPPKIEYDQETLEVSEDEAKQILEQLEPKFNPEKIEQNQKIVDEIIKRIENNKAVLMGKLYPDNIDPESIEGDKILERYKKVEQEQALIKEILQRDIKDL